MFALPYLDLKHIEYIFWRVVSRTTNVPSNSTTSMAALAIQKLVKVARFSYLLRMLGF